MTQIQATGSGIRTLHILLSTMTKKHPMDPKIYIGGDMGFLNVFKYKVSDGKQFIIPSRNLTELLQTQGKSLACVKVLRDIIFTNLYLPKDPVTHIECFRLQDQHKTIIVVGQSPIEPSTYDFLPVFVINVNNRTLSSLTYHPSFQI
jgi:hypothetical protein